MAAADGSITIEVEIDTSGAEQELEKLSKSAKTATKNGVDPLSDSFEDVGKKSKSATRNAVSTTFCTSCKSDANSIAP